MEELIINLIEEINKNMPQLSLVDEDYGQLDAIDDEIRICTHLHILQFSLMHQVVNGTIYLN